MLPGTVNEKVVPILEEFSGRRAGSDFGVAMNPEFLREGSAISDYYDPSFVVIGQMNERSGDAVQNLYAAVDAKIIRTSIKTAEMMKYANNSFHALEDQLCQRDRQHLQGAWH